MIHVDEKNYTELLRKASKWDALVEEWYNKQVDEDGNEVSDEECDAITLFEVAQKHIEGWT